ncbi:MAG: SDR family oxidoreductase [Hyphomicrobiales bacterium]|nr:SDR family oxidoreductase [Hyphomicrobiales bacterium]
MTQIPGRKAIVTGGGSGVGAAIALALAQADIPVIVTGRRLEALEEIAASHALITPHAADVTDEQSLERLFGAASADGTAPDIVVANAGMAESAPLNRTSTQLWLDTLNVNLTGVFMTFRAAMAAMDRKAPGRLIAISSTAGLKGYPYVSAYCAAKHGVVGLVRALALEVAKSPVTANAICPGFTETPMLERSIEKIVATTGMSTDDARKTLANASPQGRFIQPEEIAATVLWLCQAQAASVNGQAIALSGGEV